MKEIEFIDLLDQLGMGVFTVSDAARLINKGKDYVYICLSRLVKRGHLIRVEKGKYTLKKYDEKIVATNLIHPSYISFISGLYLHNRTTQIPREVQVITSSSKKNITYNGYVIRFVRFPQKRIFGYGKQRGVGNVPWFLGDLEKIIVDSLYLPRYCPISESYYAIKEGIDIDRLIVHAKRMGSSVTMKRVGYLLERSGMDVPGDLHENITRKYDPLNPQLPREGKMSVKWRLIINEVLEDA